MRNALLGQEMLYKTRKSLHNAVVLAIHVEHLLKKKQVPPHEKQPRNKSARVMWSAEHGPQRCPDPSPWTMWIW